MNLYLVTSNPNKLREFNQILGQEIDRLDIDVPEIQSLQLEEVITAKAEAAWNFVKKPVIVEDVSLEIPALGGLPGPLVKWFLQAVGVEGVLNMLMPNAERTVIARELVDVYDGEQHHLFEGRAEGTLAREPRGDSGFGFDKIMIPDGHDKTYAELDPTEKNRISHRALALEKLGVWLRENRSNELLLSR